MDSWLAFFLFVADRFAFFNEENKSHNVQRGPEGMEFCTHAARESGRRVFTRIINALGLGSGLCKNVKNGEKEKADIKLREMINLF